MGLYRGNRPDHGVGLVRHFTAHSSQLRGCLERGVKIRDRQSLLHAFSPAGMGPHYARTDTAFGLLFCNTIIHEIKVYDEHFMKVRSYAPYLIDPSSKPLKGRKVNKQTYLRHADGKPLVGTKS